MKKFLVAVLVLMIMFVLVGCGGGEDTPAEPENGAAGEKEEFKVALLTPGSINDQGWNAAAYAGLKAIEAEFGAEISHVETPNPGDKRDAFTDYAERWYDLIIGHSFAYQDSALEGAPDYPDTIFVTIGGANTAPNLAPFMVKSEDPAYLAGIIAAMVSKTGKAGFIGGSEIPSIEKTLVGYELGAKSINPDFEVLSTWVGNLTDVNVGYEAALSQIREGADVIYSNANAVELGVLKATDEEGIYSFGMTTDKSHLSPEHMIGSVIVKIDQVYVEIARRVIEGEFEGSQNEVGLIDDTVELKWNDNVKQQLPQEVIDTVNETIEKIMSGEFRVPGELDL